MKLTNRFAPLWKSLSGSGNTLVFIVLIWALGSNLQNWLDTSYRIVGIELSKHSHNSSQDILKKILQFVSYVVASGIMSLVVSKFKSFFTPKPENGGEINPEVLKWFLIFGMVRVLLQTLFMRFFSNLFPESLATIEIFRWFALGLVDVLLIKYSTTLTADLVRKKLEALQIGSLVVTRLLCGGIIFLGLHKIEVGQIFWINTLSGGITLTTTLLLGVVWYVTRNSRSGEAAVRGVAPSQAGGETLMPFMHNRIVGFLVAPVGYATFHFAPLLTEQNGLAVHIAILVGGAIGGLLGLRFYIPVTSIKMVAILRLLQLAGFSVSILLIEHPVVCGLTYMACWYVSSSMRVYHSLLEASYNQKTREANALWAKFSEENLSLIFVMALIVFGDFSKGSILAVNLTLYILIFANMYFFKKRFSNDIKLVLAKDAAS